MTLYHCRSRGHLHGGQEHQEWVWRLQQESAQPQQWESAQPQQ
jgi:hypothetical protein